MRFIYAEEGLRAAPCSECALNALAIDEPPEHARLYLEGNMQMWVDAEDSSALLVRRRRATLAARKTTIYGFSHLHRRVH